MKSFQKIQLIVFLVLLFGTTNSFAQKDTNIGYMGKRFILNTYSHVNIFPLTDSRRAYNENAPLNGIRTALNLEGEYIINRRFGFTLGTMRQRFGSSRGVSDVRRAKVRTVSLGIKNYLRREGGLAPVGFYQHLRYQRVFGKWQDFKINDGTYEQTSEQFNFSDDILAYGAGVNFGFGKLPLFSLGADFILPISAFTYDSPVGDTMANLLFNMRLGIVMPLF